MSGDPLRQHIEKVKKEVKARDDEAKKEQAKLASMLPGKVVFLKGTRPWNYLDWQVPLVSGSYDEVRNHTHRCYIEKDTPGPANMGHQLCVLDPARPDLPAEILVDAGEGWIGCAMSASHDGQTLYFCMAPDDTFFHIYRIPISGGKPVQLKCSCGVPVIEFQQASQTLTGLNLASEFTDPVCWRGKMNPFVLPLVVAFSVNVRNVIRQHLPQ